MNARIIAIVLSYCALTAAAQPTVRTLRQQSLRRYNIPAGNYSGITHIGGTRYAVCDDKSADGFSIWNIDVDSVTGKIRNVRNEGFHASGGPNRDTEDLAFVPELQTLFMVSEAEGRIYAYATDGTAKPWPCPTLLDRFSKSTGLEALTWDKFRQCLWVMEENNGEGQCRLLSINAQGTLLGIQHYTLDPSRTQKKGMIHAHGVSAICATDDGKLLILEREAYVPKKKIGAWVNCKLYSINPKETTGKQLITEWRTHINLTARSWANYEGMCFGPRLTDGRRVLILVSDSQGGYGGVLRDRIRTIILP